MHSVPPFLPSEPRVFPRHPQCLRVPTPRDRPGRDANGGAPTVTAQLVPEDQKIAVALLRAGPTEPKTTLNS